MRIRFTPFATGLQADYTPALLFTDGSVALYVAQFDMFPDGVGARRCKALPSDLNNQRCRPRKLHYVFHDRAGPVLAAMGDAPTVARRPPTTDTTCSSAACGRIETPAMVGFVDPQLPEWIRGSLVADRARDARRATRRSSDRCRA